MKRVNEIVFLLLGAGIGMVLACFVYGRMAKLYSASVVVSDETKEMSIAVGLKASMAGKARDADRAVDNPDVYHRILESPDFLAALGCIDVGDGTYAQHLKAEAAQFMGDVLLPVSPPSADSLLQVLPVELEAIRRHVKHSENRAARTIQVSVFDTDPQVAALMADSVVERLQHAIRAKKMAFAKAEERHLAAECRKALADYAKAQTAYGAYADSHRDAVADSVIVHQKHLKQEFDQAYRMYADACERHLRARFLLHQSSASFTRLRGATVPLEPLTPRLPAVLAVGGLMGLLVGWWGMLLRRRLLNGDGRATLGGWFSPWAITLYVWAAILVVIHFEGAHIFPLTQQFWDSIVLWVPILCVTAFVTCQLLAARPSASALAGTSAREPGALHVNVGIFRVLLVLTLVMTPLFAWNVYQIVSQFSAADMLNNVRVLANASAGQGVLRYSIVINQVLLIIALWSYPRVPMWQVTFVVAACLLNALAIMEKGGIFFVVLMCLYVLYERGVVRLRSMALAGVAVVGGFYLFNLMRAGENSDYTENETFLDFIGMYLTSPSVAFSRLTEELTPQFGTNTFEFFYAVFDKLGLGTFVVHDKVQDFMWVPMPTNVYTIMQPFFVDFGRFGVAFFAALYGVLFGVLYRAHLNGESIGRALYSYAVFILILQFYQDNLMLSLSYIIQMTMLVVLLSQRRVRLTL